MKHDKSAWGPGPWQEELDRYDWVSQGFACMALRGPHGAWCSYVGVPVTHPLYGKNYDDVDVSFHGGLTYSNKCDEEAGICHVPQPGMPHDVWWLGGDFAHAYDYVPAFNETRTALRLLNPLANLFKPYSPNPGPYDDVYRDINYVRAQTDVLARQLAEAAR